MGSRKKDPSSITRDRLLKSALKIFSQKGFALASIREIAKDSGTTLPSIYYYFGSKEGLYQELMRVHFSILDSVIEKQPKTGSVRERIKSLFISIYCIMIKDVEFIRLMRIITYGPPQSAPIFDFGSYQRRLLGFIKSLIIEGVSNGEFRSGNADDMTLILRGALHVAAEELCFSVSVEFNQKSLERILDIIFDGISADKQT